MKILSLNSGSSSVKYSLYDWGKKVLIANGIVERVGLGGSFVEQNVFGKGKTRKEKDCSDHKEAIQLVLETLTEKTNGVISDLKTVTAVGHRVVHGGERFVKSVVINDEVVGAFKKLSALAPLHNPPNICGIEAARHLMPDIPHMAIMDTAWHQTMPASSFLYALPYEWYKKYSIRRYGFHGTSFLYVAKRTSVLLNKNPFKSNIIIAHIGNGSSINVVKNGLSYDTSMGFTPLEGLVMGTRAGDHDPAIDLFMMRKENISPENMDKILNKKSGIFGITGQYTDRRDVEKAAEAGDERAKLAIDIEAYRLRKYIGAYAAAAGGVDAVVFTAGVGERGSIVREKSLENLEYMGIKLDREKNRIAKTRNAECEISTADSRVKIFIVPTDEERVFVEDVAGLLSGTYDVHTRFEYTFQKPSYRNMLREKTFEKEVKENPDLLKVAVNHASASGGDRALRK